MPYRICKTLEVENAHMLSKHPDNCKYPHGHSRRIEFVLESNSLDSNEMVCDFKIIKEACMEFVEKYDHAICMNTNDKHYQQFKDNYKDRVIGYENMDPTTEVLAKDIYDRCNQRLKEYRNSEKARFTLAEGVKLVAVRVWETSTSWAEYSE